jgi:hypothetical protein
VKHPHRPRTSRSPAAAPEIVRFLLRLPRELHRSLKAHAATRRLSLNELCVRTLAAGRTGGAVDPDVRVICDRARLVAGSHYVGLLAHGSSIRGDARTTSDTDVLVVVDRALPLTRTLYRRWDEQVLTSKGRPVDAHFVHLPSDPDRAGGLWCEAAVEGRLWDDPSGVVEDTMARVRRAIADGRLVRRRVHGQPYWTVAA